MKPLADHGTTARAKGRPAAGIKACPCRKCRDAENRYDKRRRVFNATGRPVRVPAQPAADHLRLLFATPMGWADIREATGCSTQTITGLLNGQLTVKRSVADRILAVRATVNPQVLVPALGSTRRLRALVAIGHKILGAGGLVERIGLNQTVLSALLSGRKQQVKVSTEERIRLAYDRLKDTPGSSLISERRAAENDWLGPIWWDDDELDNPDYVPTAKTGPRYVALGENCLELERQELTREQIAERLGVTRDGLQKALSYYRKTLLADDDMRKAA
ncbi:hypothetical protein OS965_02165 [Streptomyces sp. H27-G5]|uniref:hypothetical protein n=1 Tax=Streptomyces sp. H27-G5 TaxID=2996698 RepID=UPI0022707773|nr:hypothetical protein [Streptomyces sp. H27-G5]MCY0916980.1 hypothetical protein [Streptomyces sp. H27-G5]